MRHLLHTPFGAVLRTELLLNSRRVAPYALMALFSANAVLWCMWGPAAATGWATNSDYYIARLFGGFSFMTMPFFIAMLMGDPVVRDQRAGVDSLILATPVGRAEYLMGKFLGNFVVLVCCLGVFALTACLLQAFARPGMAALPVRFVPYLTHFFLLVVISSLAPAAVCFTVGTLTRSPKLVYGLVSCGYLLYIALQIAIKDLPLASRISLDPLMFNLSELHRGRTAGAVNQLVLDYSGGMLANRLLMVLVSVMCLTALCARFPPGEQTGWSGGRRRRAAWIPPETERAEAVTPAAWNVRRATGGPRAIVQQLTGATSVELRLLFAERSLVVFLSLAVLVCFAGLAYDGSIREGAWTEAYVARATESISLFLLAIAVFYTGETLHRDRELRIEPVLWSMPAPDAVFILAKLGAMVLLSLLLIVTVFATTIALQIIRGHAPVDAGAYLLAGLVILVPNTLFLVAASAALHHVLRDKYLAYTVCLGIVGGLVWLYNLGYNHPLWNPLLYGLWTPADLTPGSGRLPQILVHRAYCLVLTALCLSVAHFFFGRRGTAGKGPR